MRFFGVLKMSGLDDSGSPIVWAAAPSAFWFLQSLAVFQREDRQLPANWERPGTSTGPYQASQSLTGTKLVEIMERERKRQDDDARPLGTLRTVAVLIKGRKPGTSQAGYLVHLDEVAAQYQLVGGRIRADDIDRHSAAMHEVKGRLHSKRFPFDFQEFDVTFLETVRVKDVSRTYGVYTEYEISFFRLLTTKQLQLPSAYLWVTKTELLRGEADDYTEINNGGLEELDRKLQGGLDGLGRSVPETA